MNIVSIVSNLFFLLVGIAAVGLITTYIVTLTKKKRKENNLRYLGKEELVAAYQPKAEAIVQKSVSQANFVFKYDPQSQKYSSRELDGELQKKKRITIVNTNVQSRVSTNFN